MGWPSEQFVHRFGGPDELWDGMLAATVRMSALITPQPEDVRRRIRAAFDRLAAVAAAATPP